MKASFLYLLNENKKHNFYVVHQVECQKTLIDRLHENDIVFFDDCLYSQYLFLRQNNIVLKKHNIKCVLSFSTNIYRHTGKPIEYAECAQCHDRFHNGDMSVLQCYMSLDEVRELLENDNMYLACHGHNHLQLEALTSDKVQQSKLFSNDIKTAANMLRSYRMQTSIFVYPYEYDNFYLAQHIAKMHGYNILYGDNSIQRVYL